ncbi:hypothetical protein TELCIR_10445 [Teladorsagia circumcincta]|uniref:Uncharacterized protein n=1 Tax=Teladorsagia circumcincta TaxID=45464 RepID=A0A2G9UC37_TELCI|nr:hypothetical protein TELCIR_10445 [Teladorsagia circumcincta]
MILCETVAVADRVAFLAAILERKPHISISSEMLLKMARSSSDQHFFTTVVLCQCMGYSSFPEELDDKFVHDLNRLLKRLSFGVDDLIPPATLNGDFMQHRDPADSIRILASHDWFFYEESLLKLADSLSNSAVALVSKVHKVSPNKAYRLLCQPLEGFHGATLSQLAFQVR